MATFLVTAATGRQGGSTARELLARGAKVHAFVRDPSAPAALALQSLGAVLFQGDFDDVPAIIAATAGVTGVFLNTYPNFEDLTGEVRYAQNFVDAALAAKTVRSFVVSTVFKANYYDDWSVVQDQYPFLSLYFSIKSGVEKVVRAAGFESYTILRPCWLMHNYEAASLGPSFHFPEFDQRILTVSYPKDFKQPHLDAFDVGKFAAAALLEPVRFKNHEIDLAAEHLTFYEVAKALSDISGVKVKAKFRTEQETAELLKAGTLPALAIQLWAPKNDYAVDQETLSKYGIKLTTFADYLKREQTVIKAGLGA